MNDEKWACCYLPFGIIFGKVLSASKFVSYWLILQAVMSMFHDLGFVSRHHIIPDRLARYVPLCQCSYWCTSTTCCSS